MARTIGEQIYEDQLASGQIQLSDVLPQDYGYTGSIEEDSEFDTPYGTRTGIAGYYDRLTGPIKNTFQKYGAPIMGGLMSAFTGCLLYTSPSPRDGLLSRMPSSA